MRMKSQVAWAIAFLLATGMGKARGQGQSSPPKRQSPRIIAHQSGRRQQSDVPATYSERANALPLSSIRPLPFSLTALSSCLEWAICQSQASQFPEWTGGKLWAPAAVVHNISY